MHKSSVWRRSNPGKDRATREKYYSVERNFIFQTMKRPYKPSVMYPKQHAKAIKDKLSYVRTGWIPKITLEEMYEELMIQIELMKNKFPGTDGKLCRYCEQPWTYIRKGNKKEERKIVKTNFSVDRFNSDETYKKGNIVFCCNGCNTRKNSTTKKDWLKYLEIDKEING